MQSIQTTARDSIESDVLQQVRNYVQETILLHARPEWSDEKCENVEDDVLRHTKVAVSALATQELSSTPALQRHIDEAVAETKRLLHGWR
jgi:predicted NAD/FAD-dependent oxidoreductase